MIVRNLDILLGLDLITGNVKNFSKEIRSKNKYRLQKIELNKLLKDNLFYNYIEANNLLDSYYYFVHSFYAKNIEKIYLATTRNYNFNFPSIIK